ncbi:MAG: aminotransferase class V-fold PLP-dependent enzyme [Cytophagales bacterium]|nr:aminotransferase class V-fold PLP-dependent enzyme [Cytophagales bacterium]
MNRRTILKKIGLGVANIPFIGFDQQPDIISKDWRGLFTEDKIKDESFWKKFRREFYEVSGDFINLENGYFGVHPKPVHRAYVQYIEKVNSFSSRYMRTEYLKDFESIITGLATFTGVDKEELLITRNATEAMNILIQGLDLKKGDEIILHRQDYPSMIETFEMLARRNGLKLRFIRIPLIPESDEQIVSLYKEAVTPATRCILLTHMIHLTGQLLPVKKIADTLKPKGITIILDAAHSFAQVDFKLMDLGVDFVGVNLHKWFSNPLGAGMLYVKKEKISDLNPFFGDNSKDALDISKLGHFGTLATPILLTIPASQAFNELVTIPVKEKRLRYLQNYWTREAAKIPRVTITTPIEPNRSCALASFQVAGMPASEVVHQLNERYRVFTVIRQLEEEQVVRVTPNLYNHPGELDVLLEGIESLARR